MASSDIEKHALYSILLICIFLFIGSDLSNLYVVYASSTSGTDWTIIRGASINETHAVYCGESSAGQVKWSGIIDELVLHDALDLFV